MKIQISLIVLLILSTITASAETAPPVGWRFPNSADVSGGWKSNWKSNPYPYHIQLDFDGDGNQDDVWILIKQNGHRWGLFAFRSKKESRTEVISLEENSEGNPQAMGLAVAPAKQSRKTACGNGYWKCKKGEPEEIILSLPAINYFQFEAADSLFVWDSKKEAFSRIWMSD